MDLMEYQGKELFRRYDIPTTPPGEIAKSAADAEQLAKKFGVPVMVKAQVLTGGRGKAGGVKFCKTPEEARENAQRILGLDIKGHIVDRVLVEPASDIAAEYYMSILHDRVSKGYKVIASVEGGVEIEETNRTNPEKVAKVDIDPTVGIDVEKARSILGAVGFEGDALEGAADMLVRIAQAFVETDATLFEVNPLISTPDGKVIALDAKISLDGNAMFRHPDYADFERPGPQDSLEAQAKAKGLHYVKLDGNIGVMGNGAGLVMSTLDVVQQAGGAPANFLDAGGGASADSMAQGIAFVLGDPQVQIMLINIFGGITRCDDVARGVLGAMDKLGDIPQQLVVRLDGTNAEEGRRILADADNPKIVTASKMVEAAQKAVSLAGKSLK